MSATESIEIVTVFHRPANKVLAEDLVTSIEKFEPGMKVHLVDNMKTNRGFARGCNVGAAKVEAPIIGFLNPDVRVDAPFSEQVVSTLSEANVVITGNRFGKSNRELKIWGCKDWCCGATFFVDREWFLSRGGFDEQFVMYFEETDLIRQAQEDGKRVKSVELPLHHASPVDDPEGDMKYKQFHFARSGKRFYKKWGIKQWPPG